MHKGTIGVLLGGVLAVTAWAAPLDLREVNGSARWVIHLDAQAFWASQFGTQLMRIVDSNELQVKLEALKTLSGSDLTTDIHSITLFGPDGDERHVVAMARGHFNAKKLVSILVLTPGYQKKLYGTTEVHQWHQGEGGKTQVMAFASDNQLVMSQSQATLEKALDVLAGRADSVQGTGRFKAMKRVPDRALVVACAEDLSEITQGKAHAAMLQRSSMLAFMVGEKEGFLNTTLQLETESAAAADQIEAMGRGILAMIQFQKDKLPQITSLIGACRLSSEDKTVEFAFRYPLEKLMPIIQSNIRTLKDQLK
ncbi:MAG: hypothetical protein K9N55_05500 [Phycisphaerae bacterium]|nr:hypothetical protein [Phycisphaerae bacterium]